MKIVANTAALLLAAALFAEPAMAEGDPEAGKQIGYTCLGCHGIEGYRNAYPSFRVPKLGGQKAGYIEIVLRGYRAGTRKHPTMVAQATSLSDQEIAVASIYGTLDGVALPETVLAARPLLPLETVWVPIEGGNHAQFGWYGFQEGDNQAVISRQEQQAQVVEATLALLQQILQP